ncbi:unnamed protein product [Enterobius vermicularis]|uniref:FERM domain-containing protein n=1 Tax=Enterobius vermicularis TaxID=51028 RepID=A0A0N4UZC6_ENTVE|nr:unnamed protein product [Enterobius vermicularis]
MQRKPTNLRVDDGFADHQIAGQHIITITTASSFTIDDGLLSKSAKEKNHPKPSDIVRFENVGRLLKFCNNEQRDLLEAETKHLLLRLEESHFRWFGDGLQKKSRFFRNALLKPPPLQRIKSCVHNPAYEPEQSMMCHKVLGHGKNIGQTQSCDLGEETCRSNVVRALMMSMEKYDMFIMNPLFGSGLDYYNKANAPTYYAKGRSEMQGNYSKLSPNESWSERYPLHKAAYDDNVEEVKRLLAKGMNANELDNASWTPLHYCAFYNNLRSMEALLVCAKTDVNFRNKAGSTPLHFAALQAHPNMVELLLTHSSIDTEIKDSKGYRALDICACVPKEEHQKVAKLLRNWTPLEKIQVELMDGGNAQLSLVKGDETTAGQLHDSMCKELKLNAASGSLFAIWICSERLSLQLKEHHKPLLHMKQWSQKVAKFGSDNSYKTKEEIPKLYFRRDARVSLTSEKAAKLTPDALSLLYSEAQQNYMKGLYPCSDQDVAQLASIILQIIHGKSYELNSKIMESLMPFHRIPTTESGLSVMKRAIEKEYHKKKATNLVALQSDFLHICWRFCVYGSTFFDAIIFMKKPVKGSLLAHVGVNDYGLHLINANSKTLFKTYPLKAFRCEMEPGRPYIDVHAETFGHSFTIKTSQVSSIIW